MTDRSNEPRTILAAGVALLVLAIALVPVVWWLLTGVDAGIENSAQTNNFKTDVSVRTYSAGLVVLALVLGLASLALFGSGGMMLWKGLRRARR